MKIKQIYLIDRAPFRKLKLDLSNKHVISLTGINGVGKTTILSYIVDAFHEIARKAFHNEFSGTKYGKYYRISSSLFNMPSTSKSMVFISFEADGQEIHYIDMYGIINENDFNELMSVAWESDDNSNWPINYLSIENYIDESKHIRYVSVDESKAKKTFTNNVLTYFPSYRYEQPGYLNDVFRMELSYKYTSDWTGYLANPIEVTTDLPQIANWMMDIVLDEKLYGPIDLLNKLQLVISAILSKKHGRKVRVGIGQRSLGGARIQIVDSETSSMIYPSIFNLSAGEASLLCIFGELLRQTDKIHKATENVEGIVLVDEVDKHLHIVLQREVIPKLIQIFPNIQFIISTHSTFVNIGLIDNLNDQCRILDLDNYGIECQLYKTEVFREAYDTLIEKNKQYASSYDALSEKMKTITKPIVYLEGRTDEKYFKKAIEVFGYDDSSFDFQWIGHIDDSGNEAFTGSGSLTHGLQYIKGRSPDKLHFFLFDCDTKKQECDEKNIVVMTIPYFFNHSVMNKGIENALELDGIILEEFYDYNTKKGDYGKVITTKELNKMKMCDYICNLDIESQKCILSNLKPVIERILARIEAENE